LVLFALLLPVLLGMLGLVLDGGLLMAAHRQARNAADAAAMAAALDKLRGASNAMALATANQYMTVYNNLPDAPPLVPGVSFNIPPKAGPYAGNAQYVEVIVTVPVKTLVIQVLGISSDQTVTARAVAGYEAVPAGEGIITLDPNAGPGLQVSGGALIVNGRVQVNAQATTSPFGALVSSTLRANTINVVGGVNTPANFQNIPPLTANPLTAGALPESDPLLRLPTPSTANGVDATDRGSVNISSGTVTLDPGVYSSLQITGGTVTLNPGIYVLKGGGMTISGSANVTGSGVMFYNTGSDYLPSIGLPDLFDGSALGTDTVATFGGVTINAANVNLQPLNIAGNPFNGMLLYQRRWNTQDMNIQGNAGSDFNLGGTVYASWGRLSLTGKGQFNNQFIVRSMNVNATADLTVDYVGRQLGKANAVFLVE
jgi:hypothetical protein